ncbi:hypothetical protein SAMN04488503_0227 [Humidesulfovibrio mexicanus]|uniref:Uncharacterized protein n=1 Tax=Humidesulfovibrio mexicanus TaxID=147047 RepID=A0A238XLU3_9BACT|nr:hypothetical protein [Humidesulfovibrio mexicanus]SNR59433.1 hypothetical protein SAMN04488503_0227 [Humidesulfovibrio mexicanus]
MSQYRLNQQGEQVLVRQCEHPQETCLQCHFWADCILLAIFKGKHADKRAKAFLKKRNPNGQLARMRAGRTA